MFNGKINYFDWAIFNSKLFVYQRVTDNANLNTYNDNDITIYYLS